MKIALCLSGQARSYKTAYEYIKRNLLDQYDVDVYYHTWDDDPVDQDELWNLYQPVRCQVDPPTQHGTFDRLNNYRNPDKKDQEYWSKRIPADSTISQFYSIMVSNALQYMSGLEYDWVIKMRFDFALNTVIDFNQLDSRHLFISDHTAHLSDVIAWGNQEMMMKYSGTFHIIPEAHRLGIMMLAEDLLNFNLHKRGVNHDIVRYDLNDPFPPSNVDGAWTSVIRDDLKEWLRNPEVLERDFPV